MIDIIEVEECGDVAVIIFIVLLMLAAFVMGLSVCQLGWIP